MQNSRTKEPNKKAGKKRLPFCQVLFFHAQALKFTLALSGGRGAGSPSMYKF